MKIIYLVSQLNPSGPINQAFNIVTGLKSLGISVYLVTLFHERGESKIYDFFEADVNIIQLRCTRKNIFKAAYRLFKIVNDLDIDIVHSSGVSADLANVLSHHKALKMCTIRSHVKDLHERRNFFIKFVSQLVYKNTLKKLDIIVACSRSLANDISEETGETCLYVRNGVDINKFYPISIQEKEKIRRILHIPLDKLVYIVVGALEPRKNVSTIIEAVKQLCNPNIFLLVVGRGPERAFLEEMTRNNDNIQFFGGVFSPLELYQCSDIFVSCSLAEGFPNTVLEALACGLPVILSNIGSHKEFFEYDNSLGALFDEREVASLKNTIEESLTWNLKEKSVRARLLASNKLNSQSTASNYLNIYRKILHHE